MPKAPPPKTPPVEPRLVDYGEWQPKYDLLSCTLQLAVPLWIDKLRRNPWEVIQERAKICSQHIAEHGDIVLFKSKKKGESAEAFNCLAEGIACLAFCPGGVKIFGAHWESCLNEDVPSRSSNSLAALCQTLERCLRENANRA